MRFNGFELSRYQMFCVRVLVLHQPRKSKSLQSKAGADVNREERILMQRNRPSAWCIGQNNENQSIFGSKKMESTLRNKSRITKQIELSALGRHAFCKGKSRAGDATVLDFPVENLRPCSQFIWLLYGQNLRQISRKDKA